MSARPIALMAACRAATSNAGVCDLLVAAILDESAPFYDPDF